MAVVKSKMVKGSQVWYDDTYAACKRWLDVCGDVRVWRFQPGTSLATGAGLVVTEDGTNAETWDVVAGSGIKVVTGGTEYNGDNIQFDGASISLASYKPLWMHATVAVNEATQSDLLVALAGVNTALLATDTAHGVASTNFKGVGFLKVDGVTTLSAQLYNAAGAQASFANAPTAFSTADTELDFEFDGSYGRWYVNGAQVLEVGASSLPATVLTPSINIRAGSGAARTLQVKKFWVYQIQ
jgi:hypothetical protein